MGEWRWSRLNEMGLNAVVRDNAAGVSVATPNLVNALEADKAALLEALRTLVDGVYFTIGQDGIPLVVKAEDLLSRIQSEGAEVKAGE